MNLVNYSKHITVLQSTYISSIIGNIRASTTIGCCAFLVSLLIWHQVGSARGMVIGGEGVSVVRPDILHWPCPWPAVWTMPLPMTASYLSTLYEFEFPAWAWKIDALDLKPSGGLVSLSSTPTYMRPSSNLAVKLTKNESSKFKF